MVIIIAILLVIYSAGLLLSHNFSSELTFYFGWITGILSAGVIALFMRASIKRNETKNVEDKQTP